MASTPMDLDEPGNGVPSFLNITRSTVPSTTKVSDVIATFRPTKLFHHHEASEGRPTSHVLSIDFDDPGDLCLTSESDETIHIYNVKEGRHDKTLMSKKYGVKLAKFAHHGSSIIYASTKQNDAIRYLATHDTSFIRYFEGHEAAVTSIELHPGSDMFLSCSLDNTVRLWDLGTKQWVAKLNLNMAYLAAWDPSGKLFGVGSAAAGQVLLFDQRNYSAPFATFDVLQAIANGPADQQPDAAFRGWTALSFSNDGRHILLGSKFGGHFLLDSFDGSLKAYLRKPAGSSAASRAAPGEAAEGGAAVVEGSGADCCFSPDGRYVLGGGKKDVFVWDTLDIPATTPYTADGGGGGGEGPVTAKVLEPVHVLETEGRKEAPVVMYSPRYNMFATADEELMFWLPDPHA